MARPSKKQLAARQRNWNIFVLNGIIAQLRSQESHHFPDLDLSPAIDCVNAAIKQLKEPTP